MHDNKATVEAKNNTRPRADAATTESEEIYFWIDRLISGSDKPAQVDGCEALVNYFEKRRFKKDIPAKKTMRDYTIILRKCIKRKRSVIRKRMSKEKKHNADSNTIASE